MCKDQECVGEFELLRERCHHLANRVVPAEFLVDQLREALRDLMEASDTPFSAVNIKVGEVLEMADAYAERKKKVTGTPA